MSHASKNNSAATEALFALAKLILALPANERAAVVQSVVSFRPGRTIAESFDVGPLRAAFSDYWEARTGEPLPVRDLKAALLPPIPIGTVLEFSKLNFLGSYEEIELATAGLVEHLLHRISKIRSTGQRLLFDTETPRDAAYSLKMRPLGITVPNLTHLVASGIKFPTIYADPPWSYDNEASRGAAVNHYPTMSPEEICREPVRDLAEENAHLHLWTTNGFLREAFDVMEAWGFEFKSCLVWVKDEIGMGNYWRVSHEFLVLGVRGHLTFRDKSVPSWIQAHRTIHSRKPGIVRALIERVSPGPYLEMYGREELPESAWTVYGNAVEKRLF